MPEQTGEGKNGTWKKQNIIVDTDGQYPKSVCITFWGDRADRSLFREGASVRVHFDLESREFKGSWYTDVKGWKVESAHGGGVMASPPAESEDDSGSGIPEVDLPPF